MITLSKRLKIIMGIAALLLLVPLIAMQFSKEVNWELRDFVIAGVLLFGTGLLIELILRTVLRTVKNRLHRVLLLAFTILALLLIWIELGVGIFGSPFAGS